jgi:hypothetical protein
MAALVSLVVLCIAVCEYYQILFVTPSAASTLRPGDQALLARVVDRPRVVAPSGEPWPSAVVGEAALDRST